MISRIMRSSLIAFAASVIGMGGRFYEALAIIFMAAGVNILTSISSLRDGSAIIVQGGALLLGGLFFYFIAERSNAYIGRAREEQRSGEGGLLRHHLSRMIEFELQHVRIWVEAGVFVIALGFIIVATVETRALVAQGKQAPECESTASPMPSPAP